MQRVLCQSLVFLAAMSSACGRAESKERAANDDQVSTIASVGKEVDYGVVEISKGLRLSYPGGAGFKIMVIIDFGRDGRCYYDAATDETPLKIIAGVQRDGEASFHVLSGVDLPDRPKIVAPGNLCNARYPYDYKEAPIYLAEGSDRLQLGAFVPVVNGTESTTPLLCEDTFESVCSVNFKASISSQSLAESRPPLAFAGLVSLDIASTSQKFTVYQSREP